MLAFSNFEWPLDSMVQFLFFLHFRVTHDTHFRTSSTVLLTHVLNLKKKQNRKTKTIEIWETATTTTFVQDFILTAVNMEKLF